MGVLDIAVRVSKLADTQTLADLQMVRLALVIAFQTTPESSQGNEPTSPPASGEGRSMSGMNATALILLHAALSVGFAVVVGKPARQLNNIAFLIIMSANNYIAIPISTIDTVAAFVYQTRRSGGELTGFGTRSSNAISTHALALQGIIFLALAALWPFRFGLPRNLRAGEWWVVTEWYAQVGWVCVNNAIVAVGQFLVLYTMSNADSDGAGSLDGGERNALLGSSW